MNGRFLACSGEIAGFRRSAVTCKPGTVLALIALMLSLHSTALARSPETKLLDAEMSRGRSMSGVVLLAAAPRNPFPNANRQAPELAGGVNTHDGQCTYSAVAEALGLPYAPPGETTITSTA